MWRLAVVLDDRLGDRAKDGIRGLKKATKIPDAVQTLLRRRISKNEFGFDLLANQVPLAARKKNLFGWWKSTIMYAPISETEFRLIEGVRGWHIEFTWHAGCEAKEVDLVEFKHDIDAQLSDGWGEGVEQFRFGPLVCCTAEDKCRLAPPSQRSKLRPDLDGRYSFNLTSMGCASPRVLRQRKK